MNWRPKSRKKNVGTVVKSSKYVFYEFPGFDHRAALFFKIFWPHIHSRDLSYFWFGLEYFISRLPYSGGVITGPPTFPKTNNVPVRRPPLYGNVGVQGPKFFFQ